MRTSILVVLYNRQINESETLRTLQEINKSFDNCKLIIWNNGPAPLLSDDTSSFESIGLDCHIVETLENRPLSYVYNEFIQNNDSEKYIILDHDSSLSTEYWSSVKNTDDLLLLPKVISQGRICSPNKLPENGTRYKAKQKFSAITSGMVLSNTLINKIKSNYGNVFDENYAFYGIDTTFMLRMKNLALCDQISVIDGFSHSLSKDEDEPEKTKLFRAREMAISTALTTRHYPTYSSIRRFVKSISRSLRKKNNYPIKDMFEALLSGKHPRCK